MSKANWLIASEINFSSVDWSTSINSCFATFDESGSMVFNAAAAMIRFSISGSSKYLIITGTAFFNPLFPAIVIASISSSLSASIKSEGKNGLSIINVSRGIIYHGNGSIDDISKSALEYTEKIRRLLWIQKKF